MVLPHELIQHLQRCGHLDEAELSLDSCKRYWEHARHHMEWAAEHGGTAGGRHHPLFLYGDDARWNSYGDKLVLVSMGFVLDSRKHSLATHFPLFVLQEVGNLEISFVCIYIEFVYVVSTIPRIKLSVPEQGLSLGFSTLQAYMKPDSCYGGIYFITAHVALFFVRY